MGKVLLTGGAGFIGSVCIHTLINAGWDVHVLDLHTPKLKTLTVLKEKYSHQRGDICQIAAVEVAMQGCDAVVHLAAQISVPKSFEDPLKNHQINVLGTQNVLDVALRQGVRACILASSAAVYGESDKLPLDEADAGSCLSPYAESKWENEKQVIHAKKQGLNAIALRFFNVYGPGQDALGGYASVIPKFIHMMASGTPPSIHGKGLQTRDFVHVRDVANAILKLLEHSKSFEHAVANVCSQTEFSILNLVEIINQSLMSERLSGSPLLPIFQSSREGDIVRSVGNNKRLRNIINWEAEVQFEDGVLELVKQHDEEWSQ